MDARASPAGNLHSIMDCRGSASLGHRSRVTIPNTSGTFSPQMPPHAPSAWFFGVAWTCCSIKEARPVLFLIFHLVLRHLTPDLASPSTCSRSRPFCACSPLAWFRACWCGTSWCIGPTAATDCYVDNADLGSPVEDAWGMNIRSMLTRDHRRCCG